MEQDRIDHAKDRGIGRNPKAERDDSDKREGRRFEQLANGEAKISHKGQMFSLGEKGERETAQAGSSRHYGDSRRAITHTEARQLGRPGWRDGRE